MSNMVVPTASDVVRRLGEAFESIIMPSLPTITERSAATTMRHLLRYVAIRIDHEGQLLLDEESRLKEELAKALDFMRSRPATDRKSADLAAAIAATLAREADPTVYPSLPLMAERVGKLRQHVCEVLELLQALPEAEAMGAAAVLRESLRRYIAWQIEQEAGIIEPSFLGFGPRR